MAFYGGGVGTYKKKREDSEHGRPQGGGVPLKLQNEWNDIKAKDVYIFIATPLLHFFSADAHDSEVSKFINGKSP